MSSRTVPAKWKSCVYVLSAYQVHREPILTGLVGLTRQPVPTGPASSEAVSPSAVSSEEHAATSFFFPETTSTDEAKEMMGWFLDGVVHTMERRAIAMVEANEANLTELDAGKKKRKNRDDVVKDLIRQYVRQRDTIINLYDGEKAREAGFEPVVEQDPVRFHLQLRRVVGRFKSGEVEFEKSFGDMQIDPIAYGRDLESALEKIEKVLKEIRTEIRETQGTTDAKNKAIKAHDDIFIPGARCIEAAFRMAGMPELGDRVRPSVRRPGSLVDEVPGEGENPDAVPLDFASLGVDEPKLPTAAAKAEAEATEGVEQAALADA